MTAPVVEEATRTSEQQPSVVYRIDGDDKIVSVNDSWAQFAIDNDSAPLCDGVIGSLLWDHIAGADVAQIYRDLFYHVRKKMISVSFPFRCDSPDRFRRMRLEVLPLENEAIEFRAVPEVIGRHARTIDLLRPRSSTKLDSFMRICAWCKAIEVNGTWTPLEEAIDSTESLLQEPFPRLSHGICDVCYRQFSKYVP